MTNYDKLVCHEAYVLLLAAPAPDRLLRPGRGFFVLDATGGVSYTANVEAGKDAWR